MQIYKVFYNSKPLILTTSIVPFDDDTPLLFIKYTNASLILEALESNKTKTLFLYHKNEKKLLKYFEKYFPVVEAAGGMVQHQNGKYLFIYRNDKWDLPKGKIEKNEMLIVAAAREVEEETGVRGLKIISPLPVTYHLYKANGKYKLKKTYWYFMKTDYKGSLTPQIEENIQKAVWKSEEAIPVLFKNAYENIKLLFEAHLNTHGIGN